MPSLAQLVAQARSRIARLEPGGAFAAAQTGALIVDIRSNDARERDGVIPGSVHIPRTVLEWRLAEDSAWRNPHVSRNRQLILVCEDGYSSSLAAATLCELGFEGCGDVVGGFAAWCEKGLPVTTTARAVLPGELPGMGPPD